MTVEFIGIGDLHLPDALGKGGLAEYIPNPERFVLKLLKQALDFAASKSITEVLFYGDVFQGPRSSNNANVALVRFFRGNRAFNFHIILGNHDMFGDKASDGHSLELLKEFELPNVTIYEEVTVKKFGNCKVVFHPWPSADFKSSALNVAHIEVKNAKSDSGRIFDSEKLSASDAVCVIGHIHTPQRIRNCYYAGTPYQTNFGEDAKKYFHHIVYDGEFEIFNIPFKPIYRLHSVEISNAKDLKSIPCSPKDFVKLILTEGCKLTPADYPEGLNVVKIRAVKDNQDLALARIEDLQSGSEVEISSDEFLKEWLRQKPIAKSLKVAAYKLRKQILESNNA